MPTPINNAGTSAERRGRRRFRDVTSGYAPGTHEEIPRRPSPNTRHGWATRERIVEAALQEFLEHGYVRARVESITARAGVGYGTFYRYFTSKVDLIRDLAEEVYGEVHQSVTRRIDPAGPSPAPRAYRNILTFFHSVARNKDALLVLNDAVGAEPVVAAQVQELQDRYARLYGDKIGATIYHPIGDRWLIASMTTGLGVEAARHWLRRNSPELQPGAEDELDLIARIATIMTLSVIDPGALGIAPEKVKEIMTQLERPTDLGERG